MFCFSLDVWCFFFFFFLGGGGSFGVALAQAYDILHRVRLSQKAQGLQLFVEGIYDRSWDRYGISSFD